MIAGNPAHTTGEEGCPQIAVPHSAGRNCDLSPLLELDGAFPLFTYADDPTPGAARFATEVSDSESSPNTVNLFRRS